MICEDLEGIPYCLAINLPVGSICALDRQCAQNLVCINDHCSPVCGDGIIGGNEQCDDGNRRVEMCFVSETYCTVCGASCQNEAGILPYSITYERINDEVILTLNGR